MYFQYSHAITSNNAPGMIIAYRQLSAWLTQPAPTSPAAINGIMICVAPPPVFPKPPAVALAVPFIFGANITDV